MCLVDGGDGDDGKRRLSGRGYQSGLLLREGCELHEGEKGARIDWGHGDNPKWHLGGGVEEYSPCAGLAWEEDVVGVLCEGVDSVHGAEGGRGGGSDKCTQWLQGGATGAPLSKGESGRVLGGMVEAWRSM